VYFVFIITFVFQHRNCIFYHRIPILESYLYSRIVFVFQAPEFYLYLRKKIVLNINTSVFIIHPVKHKLWTSCHNQIVGPLNTACVFVQRRMGRITQHHYEENSFLQPLCSNLCRSSIFVFQYFIRIQKLY